MWGRRRSPPPDRPAPWGDDHQHRRVLVEHHDGATRDLVARDLAARGYDVRTCAGPDDRVGCPVLNQRPCPAVDGADVVVTGMLGHTRGRFITRRIRQRHPDLPIVADATDWAMERVADDVDVQQVFPLRRESLAEAVAAATA